MRAVLYLGNDCLENPKMALCYLSNLPRFGKCWGKRGSSAGSTARDLGPDHAACLPRDSLPGRHFPQDAWLPHGATIVLAGPVHATAVLGPSPKYTPHI